MKKPKVSEKPKRDAPRPTKRRRAVVPVTEVVKSVSVKPGVNGVFNLVVHFVQTEVFTPQNADAEVLEGLRIANVFRGRICPAGYFIADNFVLKECDDGLHYTTTVSRTLGPYFTHKEAVEDAAQKFPGIVVSSHTLSFQ